MDIASQVCLFNGKICNDIGLKYTGDKKLIRRYGICY